MPTMDFSKYGRPSEAWVRFCAANPEAANDGSQDNTFAEVYNMQARTNIERERSAATLLEQSGLNTKVDISSIPVAVGDGGTIPIRKFTPRQTGVRYISQGAVVYFHGGGFLFGSETSDDLLGASLAHQLGVTVLSVVYRHTPTHKHPTQHEDAKYGVRYILDNAKSLGVDLAAGLVVTGISAGASLAAAAVLNDLEQLRPNDGGKEQRTKLILGVVLCIPWLIHIENYPWHLFESREKSSKVQCGEAPVVPAERLKLFSDILAAQDPTDPLLNLPLLCKERLRGWPKTAFLVAGMDPLRDDGLIFARKLESQG